MSLARGQLEQAEPLLRAAVQDPGVRAGALFALGKLAYARRDFADSARWLHEALTVSPEASRIHYTLALAYRSQGDLGRAREHLQLRGDTEPEIEDPFVAELNSLSTGQRMLFHYALNAVYHENYPLATRMFREGLELDPANLDARVSLARTMYLGGDPDAAESELRAVLERQPENALASFLLGALKEERGEWEAAIAQFHDALGTEPGHPGAHFHLGNTLMRRGDYAAAASQYGDSLRREPGNANARSREVVALAVAGAAHSALRERLEVGYARSPGEPELGELLAALLAASPEEPVRDGARALAIARSLEGDTPTVQSAELLAMAYAETGDFTQATKWQRESLARALALNRLELMPRQLDLLARFAREEPARTPWPEGGPPQRFLPPPSAFGVFRDYPTDRPY